MSNLRQAYDAYWKANIELAATIKREYPIGNVIRWKWGEHFYSGFVVSHAYGDRIKVENSETGRERWIAAYNILEAEK